VNVAVAVAGTVVPAWQRACVDALRAVGGARVRVVRVDGAPWREPSGLAASLRGTALMAASLEPDGADGDLAGADVVLDLSGTNVASAAPHGVWSFRLGDGDENALPFAREIAAGAHTFEIELVRELNGRRECLRAGRFGVTTWYPSTVRIALSTAGNWPATMLAALCAGVPLVATGGGAAPARQPLSAREAVAFAWRLGLNLGRTVFASLFEITEWNVGFAAGGARALLSGEPLAVRWLPRPARFSFIADPFVVERDGVRALLVEQFEYGRNRGVIDALVLGDDDSVVRSVRALDLPSHLSFPHPVEIDGELYIIPESCVANEAVLYRCERFPDVWRRDSVVFPFDAVDTTLFEHDGRWWAFCTRWARGSTLGLYAFHSASPRGPWTEHALNPVVVDVATARPAGKPFVVDGTLYRSGQNCSRTYGGGVAIARIDELSPAAYRETVVRRFDGREFGRYAEGFHTVSFTRGDVVVDGKCVYHDARKLGWALRRIRARLGRMLRGRTLTAPRVA
jgi:hypothetical protein